MIKPLLPLFILVLENSYANDGSFYASGNTLIPLKETTIQLKKEILNLERKGEWMQVDIYFEFFNPGPEKELTVGFVTPPAEGDVTDIIENHPQIKNFMVMLDSRLLDYKVTRMGETEFKVDRKIAEGNDFVYHFRVKFAMGITIIRHSYLYRGGSSVETDHDFDYRLTTGITWGNRAIGDFELNISMGDDCFFAVPLDFGGTTASWTTVGIGRISKPMLYDPYGEDKGEANLKMVYLRRGKLQFRAVNFRPQKDLSLTIFHAHNEFNLWCDKGVENDFDNFMDISYGDSANTVIRKLSDNVLRLYHNLHYARMGYDFKDAWLKSTFSKYNWYIPDPALKPENVPDYYLNKEIQKLISEEEKRRKIKTDTP